MSYDTMDHAGWVERNIAAAKSFPKSASDRRYEADGRGWYAAPDQLNLFQKQAFTILGIVGGGIYNAPIKWNRVRWGGAGQGICIPWHGELATFDGSRLSDLVFLSHIARIRVSVCHSTFRELEIQMHPRDGTGGIGRRHPNLDEAVEAYRKRFSDPGHELNRRRAEATRAALAASRDGAKEG